MIKYFLIIQFLTLHQHIVAQQLAKALKINEASIESYDLLISKGAEALDKQEFNQALDYYRKANNLRSTDLFSIKMIKNVGNILAVLADKDRRDNDLKRKAEINKLLDTAEVAISQKKYIAARNAYVRVLSLNPVESQHQFALHRVEAINLLLQKNTITSLDNIAIPKTIKLEIEPSSKFANPAINNSVIAIKDEGPSYNGKDVEFSNNQKTKSSSFLDKTSKSSENKLGAQKAVKNEKVSVRKEPNKSKIFTTATTTKSDGRTPSNFTSINKTVEVKAVSNFETEANNSTKKTGDSKERVGEKKENNYAYLMNRALKAINAKNYIEAKVFFQKILTINSPQVDKNSIRSVIKSIDEVLGTVDKKPI